MSNRIGLVGYSCNNGLGELSRQAAAYCDIAKWMIKPHAHLGYKEPERKTMDFRASSSRVAPQWFWDGSDTVLFFETQFYSGLAEEAKQRGKRVVCVPMIEWTPMWSTRNDPTQWIKYVDLFVCPTKQCYDTLKDDGFPCALFQWPYDMNRFARNDRQTCERFLFVEGNGGYRDRKGAATVKRAKEMWPDMPLVVQTLILNGDKTWPEGTEVIQAGGTNHNLYDHGDVLIYPATCDGIGLQPYEAMAQGMPVIVTDGQPWNEYDSMARIPASMEMRLSGNKRPIPWYTADAAGLVEICKPLVGQHIGKQSQYAFEIANHHRWEDQAERFRELVTSGKED